MRVGVHVPLTGCDGVLEPVTVSDGVPVLLEEAVSVAVSLCMGVNELVMECERDVVAAPLHVPLGVRVAVAESGVRVCKGARDGRGGGDGRAAVSATWGTASPGTRRRAHFGATCESQPHSTRSR